MKIIEMKTNHIINPLGFNLGKAKLSFVVTDTKAKFQVAANIEVSLDNEFKNIIYTTGKSESIDNLAFELPIELKSCTRYYWRVTVWADNGDMAISDVAWFETGKINETFKGNWITPELSKDIHPVLMKEFNLEKQVKRARAYVCGLGLYEFEINNIKAGDEYLAPSCNAYDKWLQYQTYDITKSLKDGSNRVEVILGNGWYKGTFGFEGGKDEIYGDKFALICDIVIEFTDGTKTVIPSDTTWTSIESKIKSSTIYNGEVYDASFEAREVYGVKEIDLDKDKLQARLSLPVVIKERVKPIELINTPAGETVLDMGQNMAGWVEFKINSPKGTEVLLQYGEILQDGNFYRDNLRFAKAEHRYISNGEEEVVRPHFTFYGFRYVKITGWIGNINLEDFSACVLYSDMEDTGSIETSNPLVNRLFLNAKWGQKSNFIDTPTDCPQRDERMGWTGDAQVFSGTAAFNMDTYAFFTKYMNDLAQEQSKFNGAVPMIIPTVGKKDGCSSAWGDAATIIPWNMYLYYGDKTILENQFESMKAWVDYIKRNDDENGSNRLWNTGFHFGDWLALDGENPHSPTGGTEETFIASAYYFYSARIVSKAAKILGMNDVSKEYEELSSEVRKSIIDEYLTKNGRLALKNQTAYILALYMDLIPNEHRKRVVDDLNKRILNDKGYLKTGFVGTPYICRVLSENGYNEMAYKLLLNKECPSWLYPVTMGATTVWERWNSVLPDGKISGTDMNSLNHYSYGSIVEWMYRNMSGINPMEENPGFKKIKLAPMPDYRFKYVKAKFNSPMGLYRSEWIVEENGSLSFEFEVPFNSEAELILPDVDLKSISINGMSLNETKLEVKESLIKLVSGVWKIEYIPTKSYIKYYSCDMPLNELMANDEIKEILIRDFSVVSIVPEPLKGKSIKELSNFPFIPINDSEIKKINNLIGNIRVITE